MVRAPPRRRPRLAGGAAARGDCTVPHAHREPRAGASAGGATESSQVAIGHRDGHMKIFVTGGTGFTGAALVGRLLDEGHDVRVLDKQAGLADAELRERGASITYGSVTDRDAVAQCSQFF